MLSTAKEKGFPSLYITLQMPSLGKWTLKGSSRKREISTSPGVSQCMDIFNNSPQKHLDVGLNRRQTLLQTQGIAFCRAMATGKWEAVPALQLERWPESTHCLPPDLRVIMLWDIKRLFCCILCKIQPQPSNCTSTNAHCSLFWWHWLTLGGHNGLPPLVPQQTDWCKASQNPSSINWEKIYKPNKR